MTPPRRPLAAPAPEFVESRGASIAVYRYPEPVASSGPVVVVWPGMGVPANYCRPFAAELLRRGLAVVMVDPRGTGASTPVVSRRTRFGYAELADDVAAVLTALKPHLGERRIVLCGHSMGGQLFALRLALDAAKSGSMVAVSGLILIAVCLPWYRLYPPVRSATLAAFAHTIVATTAVLGTWPGWAFGGRQPRQLMNQWAFTVRRGRFPIVDGVDAESALSNVYTPTLAVSIDDDPYGPALAVDRFCEKLGTTGVERLHVRTGPTGRRLNHFSWAKDSGQIADRIAAFVAGLPAR